MLKSLPLWSKKKLYPMPYLRQAIHNVRNGVSNARVLFIGDSTTIGINGAGTTNWPNITDHLCTYLTDAGINANPNCFSGFSVADSGTSPLGSRLSVDNRISRGSWNSSLVGIGGTLGGAILYSGAAGAQFEFTPTIQIDTAKVIYSKYGATVVATAQVGSGSTVNMPASGAGSLATATATATLGTNTLKINRASGTGDSYIEAIECYNSAQKSLNVFNCGWWGSRASQWIASSNLVNSLPMITYLAPALTIIQPGINDWVNNLNVSTFKGYVQTLITAAKAVGDVMLVTPTPNNIYPALQDSYMVALHQLAAENKINIVDNHARWISYAVSNPLGFYADGDSMHPSTTGFADQAGAIKNTLIRFAGVAHYDYDYFADYFGGYFGKWFASAN